MKEHLEEYFGFYFVTLVVLFVFGYALLAPKFEAEAFNRCTGGNATYFTALFTELRVENCKQ